MKKPILLFALKCTAIIYFVAYADVTGFTTASTMPKEGIAFKSIQKTEGDKMNERKENVYFTKL